MVRLIDLTGKRFGRLMVQSKADSSKGGQTRWVCLCDCGNSKTIVGMSLTRGATQSCGCIHRELLQAEKTTHGGHGTPEYATWKSMKDRCFNPGATSFPHYGARGITVCDRWRDSFANFLADMGKKPTPQHSIERNDVNGNYEPSNCRWATNMEQHRNTRANHFLEFRGESLTIIGWSERLGIDARTIETRINRYGWTADRALSQP